MSTILDVLNSKYTVFVGSAAENDVVFNDPETSTRHCQISKVGDNNFLIVDLQSASGTFVNNKRIEKEFITEADFITVGGNIFQLTKKIDTVKAPVAEAVTATEYAQTPPKFASIPTTSNGNATTAGATEGTRKSKISVYLLSAPEDENTCRQIDKHLSTIRFNTAVPIEIDGDFKMHAGESISEYKEKLHNADIVLVFVSVDLLNNDECYERLKKVIENHNKRKTILLPILARNCMWKATPFANLPLLPKNQQPLNNKQFWNSEDDALTSVVNDIYVAINDYSKPADKENKPAITPAHKSILEIDWRKNYLWKVFWKRVAASLLDTLIIGIPLYAILYALFLNDIQAQEPYYDDGYSYMSTEELLGRMLLFYFGFVVVEILVFAFMESSKWRATPGKLIMKLQITDKAGNPISFGKSVARNSIKYLISMFANFQGALLIWIYLIAQIISYAKTKKFFHDQLSNTIIGEKLEAGRVSER